MTRGIAIDGDLADDETAEWLIPYVSHIRTRRDDVPFPEPWIVRYLCTNQVLNQAFTPVTVPFSLMKRELTITFV
jgi:hypothetical protein